MLSVVLSPFRYASYAIKFEVPEGAHFYNFPSLEQANSALNKITKDDDLVSNNMKHLRLMQLCGADYYSSMYESWLYSRGTHSSSSISGS